MNKVHILSGTLLAFAVITGCTPQNPVITKPTQAVAIIEPIPEGIYLPEATVGKSYQFDQSPWGDQISVTITNKYDSALGNTCIEARISSTNQNEQETLLCQEGPQIWKEYRKL